MIPVNEPVLDGNEKAYVVECIESGWISSEGPFVRRFEEEFAARVNRKYGVAVTNGTAALDAAVEALGIGPGDEVIVPTFTIISCLNQIVRSGATPILIDSDPATWNMAVDEIEARITARTKAIMAVHIYGLPVDLEPIISLAEKYGLSVIEDAAEAIGQTYKERPCGSFGDISTFSFYPNKHVTTGEGGMIVTDDAELAERCRGLRNLCFQPGKRFVHEQLGWNLRMTNLQAALGLAQLERLDEFVVRKRHMGARYNELFSDLEGAQLPLQRTPYADNIYWVYGMLLDDNHDLDADRAMKELAQEGIGTRPFFYPMNLQPVFRDYAWSTEHSFPVSERMYRQGFYIPSGLGLNEENQQEVAAAVKRVVG